MHRISQPRIYRARRGDNKLGRNVGVASGIVAVLIVAWVAFALLRAFPAPRLSLAVPTTSFGGEPLALQPSLGAQEAVAVDGIDSIAVAGAQNPTPIASLTKIMSALVVLHAHPLSLGQSGPSIPITEADVATYRAELIQNDSVVAVKAGEQLSELQALEGALIPSGDNVVQLLAAWDAGSTSAFVAKMNTLAKKLGLSHTHYAGPSGVDPATVSTAADQLHLAEIAMANPVFSSIVGMAQVTLPVAGLQFNVDADLGSDGIDGIKTGWVPQGGGCFVFSAGREVQGRHVSVLGAILGEEGSTPIPSVLAAAKQLVVAAGKTLRSFRLRGGTVVAKLSGANGQSVKVVSMSSIALIGWSGGHVHFTLHASTTLGESTLVGTRVGSLTMSFGKEQKTTALRTRGQLLSPSLGYRLTHL